MGDCVFTGWTKAAGSVETSNKLLPFHDTFQHELDEVMFINVHSVSSPTPTSRMPNARLLTALPSIETKCTMKKLLTLLHLTILSFCNIHNILQDLPKNVHNPVCPVSYRKRPIPVSCN